MTMPASDATSSGSAPPAPSSHRLATLDGLRAFAILSVMALHAHLPFASGGYLGVDVFFVLSGFLITQILVSDHRRGGAIRLRAFYARRSLRLMPAVVVWLVVAWLLAGSELPGLTHHARTSVMLAILTYSTNWWQATGHIDMFGEMGHAWSLAIEEQFYLLWPLLLMGILRLRWSLWRSIAILGVGVVASAVVMAANWRPVQHPAVYYRSDARAGALLVGCALGLVFASQRVLSGTRGLWALRVGGLVSAAALMAMVVWLDIGTHASLAFHGAIPLTWLLTGAVLAMLVWNPPEILVRLCSFKAVTLLATLSYGLYLWHPLVYSWVGRHVHERLAVRLVVEGLLSFLVAWLSHRIVERPFLALKDRMGKPPGAPQVATAIPAQSDRVDTVSRVSVFSRGGTASS